MPAYSSAQKQSIAQFVSLTQTKDTVAAKFLKQAGWSVEEAIDAYFQSPQGGGAANSAINQIFDEYRDAPSEKPNEIGPEGVMRYLGDIKVGLDEVTCIAISELLKSPSMGELTREGFLNGWRSAGCDTIPKMTTHAANLRSRIPTEPDLFRRVYRYAYPLSVPQGSRSLPLEYAVDQWQLFFATTKGGISWNTATTPWLDWWIEYVTEKYNRSLSKDTWQQVEVFMRKTHEDEEFGWWDESGAWPGVLDNFVAFVKQKRGSDGTMEVE
ncbi:Cullin binding-domain-containing protein [Aspergillus karnatakaensis]|uniref:defective in cullin neddylation 1 family protein n=1 Tax=Aspergillus karnatakaensis TaxID=1810916 RepID=UPI003CCCDED1